MAFFWLFVVAALLCALGWLMGGSDVWKPLFWSFITFACCTMVIVLTVNQPKNETRVIDGKTLYCTWNENRLGIQKDERCILIDP